MRKAIVVLTGLGLLLGAGMLLQAQRERVSPHETVSATMGGKKVTIEYGRPGKKGREIFGKLVPYGQVWRTGADEATTITTEGDLMVGSLHVPAGTYALFTIPGEGEWTLVINKTAKQWGAFKYDANMDLGRVKMQLGKTASPVEQLTIALAASGGNKGELTISWDTARATVPLMMH